MADEDDLWKGVEDDAYREAKARRAGQKREQEENRKNKSNKRKYNLDDKQYNKPIGPKPSMKTLTGIKHAVKKAGKKYIGNMNEKRKEIATRKSKEPVSVPKFKAPGIKSGARATANIQGISTPTPSVKYPGISGDMPTRGYIGRMQGGGSTVPYFPPVNSNYVIVQPKKSNLELAISVKPNEAFRPTIKKPQYRIDVTSGGNGGYGLDLVKVKGISIGEITAGASRTKGRGSKKTPIWVVDNL